MCAIFSQYQILDMFFLCSTRYEDIGPPYVLLQCLKLFNATKPHLHTLDMQHNTAQNILFVFFPLRASRVISSSREGQPGDS